MELLICENCGCAVNAEQINVERHMRRCLPENVMPLNARAAEAVSRLSPAEIERRALNRLSWGDGDQMVPAVIKTIVEMLQ